MADLEQRYFLNPDAVSKHLYCSVCQDVFSEPHRAPCGHSFCKKCIYMWLRQSKSCPEDRKPLQRSQLHFDFILANIIGDQMVACPFRSSGCEYVDKLECLSSHKQKCSFNPKNLPAFMKETNVLSSRPPLGDLSANELGTSISAENEGQLPTPGKPSLKMRLFCAESKRGLLCSMFDQESDSSEQSTDGKWLNKPGCPAAKKKRIVCIDDSP